MAMIYEMVRNVVLIVIVAGLVEMLLPSGQMSRYVKLVAGLFIIATILAPLTKEMERLGRSDAPAALAAWQGLPDLERGVANNNLGASVNQYAANVEKQIQQMLQLLPGVDRAEVTVEAQTGNNSQLSLSKIRIRLWVKGGNSSEAITCQQIESVVSNFYLIDPKAVEVEILTNE